MLDFVNVLKQAVEMGASDIHITIGNPPMARVHGSIEPIPGHEVIGAADDQIQLHHICQTDQAFQLLPRQDRNMMYSLISHQMAYFTQRLAFLNGGDVRGHDVADRVVFTH